VITREELCTSHLESLHRTGGESLIKSNITTDPNRPLVHIELTKNGGYYDRGIVEGIVRYLALDYGGTIVEKDCIEYGCLEETGIWTTAIKTDISRTIGGTTQYWVRGPLDENGDTYVVDIGYVYLACGDIAIRDENVSLFNNMTFRSYSLLPQSIKFVQLKRVSPTTVTPVLNHMGTYSNPDNLTRYQTGYILGYNYVDQKTDLEDIAFSLLPLLLTNYYRPIKGQTLYRDDSYRDPHIKQVIEDNLARLSRLVDRDISSKRYGSIPRYPATYTEPSDIYGPNADNKYQNNEVRYIEEGCLENDCVKVGIDETLISREVNTRALAWLLYAYCVYQLSYNDSRYEPTINLIATYLLSQINVETSLLREGHTHNDVYGLSVPIEVYNTSTSIITSLALLKAYDVTKQQSLLEYSLEISNSVYRLLFDTSSNQFVQSYSDLNITLESTAYGLTFSWLQGRADITESLIAFLSSKLKAPDQLINIDISNPNNLSIFNVISISDSYTTNQVLRINTLLYSNIQSAFNSNYLVDYIGQLDQVYSNLTDYQASDRNTLSISFVSECLLPNALWSYEFSSIFSIEDLYTLEFHRSQNLNRVRDSWPINFTWVSELSKSPKNVLGSILLSVSRALANIPTTLLRVRKSSNITTSRGSNLNRTGKDLKLSRRFREEDYKYTNRLIHKIIGGANTESSFKTCLELIEINPIEIYEPWKDVLTFDSPKTYTGNKDISNSLISGNDYASVNVIELRVKQILDEDVILETERIRAAGIKLLYLEGILQDFDLNDIGPLCYDHTYLDEIPVEPLILLLEDGTDTLLEDNGDPIYLELFTPYP
jgi:hypothetical protein